MKYVILSVLLAFGLGCQTTKFKKQARKGWQRVDQEWFSAQTKAKTSGPEKAAARTPASPGEYICMPTASLFSDFVTADNWLTGSERGLHRISVEEIEHFFIKKCDPKKDMSISRRGDTSYEDHRGMWFACCIAK